MKKVQLDMEDSRHAAIKALAEKEYMSVVSYCQRAVDCYGSSVGNTTPSPAKTPPAAIAKAEYRQYLLTLTSDDAIESDVKYGWAVPKHERKAFWQSYRATPQGQAAKVRADLNDSVDPALYSDEPELTPEQTSHMLATMPQPEKEVTLPPIDINSFNKLK